MKIDNSIKPLTGSDVSRTAGEIRQRATAAGTGGGGTGPAPLSIQLHGLQASLASSEVADPVRVAEIKQAIMEGRFQVHPEVVADRLLETVRELIGAHKA